jgi:dihydropteroate synthase
MVLTKRDPSGCCRVLAQGFLGKLTGRSRAADRDVATAAAIAGCVASGADVVRAHCVRTARDACLVSDALWRHTPAD